MANNDGGSTNRIRIVGTMKWDDGREDTVLYDLQVGDTANIKFTNGVLVLEARWIPKRK